MIQAHGDFVLMATSSSQPGFADDCTHESAVTENHVPRSAVGAPVPGTLRRDRRPGDLGAMARSCGRFIQQRLVAIR